MLHDLKIDIQYAIPVYKGDKLFEIRKNDRNFQVGDKIHFVVYKSNEYYEHPLNYEFFEIRYVLRDFEGLTDGYVALNISRYFN